MKYAIVFYSGYGQTKKISEFIKKNLVTKNGYENTIDLINLNEKSSDKILPADLDHIILGCPVYAGKFPKKLIAWARQNKRRLNQVKVSVFMVSLNAADPSEDAKKMDKILLGKLLRTMNVVPVHLASFAGGLCYLKYNWIIRLIMKRISRSAGGPVDTSKNHELTNWAHVSKFIDAVASAEKDPDFNLDPSLSII